MIPLYKHEVHVNPKRTRFGVPQFRADGLGSGFRVWCFGFQGLLVCSALQVAIVLHAAATLQFPTRDALFKELLEFPVVAFGKSAWASLPVLATGISQ